MMKTIINCNPIIPNVKEAFFTLAKYLNKDRDGDIIRIDNKTFYIDIQNDICREIIKEKV